MNPNIVGVIGPGLLIRFLHWGPEMGRIGFGAPLWYSHKEEP